VARRAENDPHYGLGAVIGVRVNDREIQERAPDRSDRVPSFFTTFDPFHELQAVGVLKH
jgi:hypothetical protein